MISLFVAETYILTSSGASPLVSGTSTGSGFSFSLASLFLLMNSFSWLSNYSCSTFLKISVSPPYLAWNIFSSLLSCSRAFWGSLGNFGCWTPPWCLPLFPRWFLPFRLSLLPFYGLPPLLFRSPPPLWSLLGLRLWPPPALSSLNFLTFLMAPPALRLDLC